MCGQYRESRNVEASLIQYIEEQLVAGSWTNITVILGFDRAYEIPIDKNNASAIIAVRLQNTEHDKIEVGSNSTVRLPTTFIDIFSSSDGQRLDLKDFLVSVLKDGFPYYEYTITNGAISDKTLNGRLGVDNIADTKLNFNSDKSELSKHDRYRHLLQLDLRFSIAES